jgi:hypothetical protein
MRSQPWALEVTTHLDHKHSYKELLYFPTEIPHKDAKKSNLRPAFQINLAMELLVAVKRPGLTSYTRRVQ